MSNINQGDTTELVGVEHSGKLFRHGTIFSEKSKGFFTNFPIKKTGPNKNFTIIRRWSIIWFYNLVQVDFDFFCLTFPYFIKNLEVSHVLLFVCLLSAVNNSYK